jgi:hypothetical protein
LRLPFSSPPTTRRVTVEVFDPASTRDTQLSHFKEIRYIALARTTQNTSLPLLHVLSLPGQTCPQSCSLATDVLLSPVYTAVTWQWVYMSHHPVYFQVFKVVSYLQVFLPKLARIFISHACYTLFSSSLITES